MTDADLQVSPDVPPAAGAEPTIAVLVLGCLLPVYDRCIASIRSTWGATAVDGVDVFYVYGGQPVESRADMVRLDELLGVAPPHLEDGEVWASGDIIVCGAADVMEGQQDCVLRKRLYAFGYLANQRSYDFVYTVCAASYVDLAELRRYVRALPSATGVYHGALLVSAKTGFPFVSGASLLLSRDLAAALANRAPEILADYPQDLADDVIFGHFIATTHCLESVEEIAARIAAGVKPTADQTFVTPYGCGSVDFVMTPEDRQVIRERAYHFHFHSRRSWEMETFHRRFFAT